MREVIPVPDSRNYKEEAMFIGVCTGDECQGLAFATPVFWDKVICRNSGITFKTFVKQHEPVIHPPFLEGFPFRFCKDTSYATFLKGIIPSYKPSCTLLHFF